MHFLIHCTSMHCQCISCPLYIDALSMHFHMCTFLKVLLQLLNSCTSTTQPIIWPVILATFLSTNSRTSPPEGCLLHLTCSGSCGTEFTDSRLRPKAITPWSLTVTKCYSAISSVLDTPSLLTISTLANLGMSFHHLRPSSSTPHLRLSREYQLTTTPQLTCIGPSCLNTFPPYLQTTSLCISPNRCNVPQWTRRGKFTRCFVHMLTAVKVSLISRKITVLTHLYGELDLLHKTFTPCLNISSIRTNKTWPAPTLFLDGTQLLTGRFKVVSHLILMPSKQVPKSLLPLPKPSFTSKSFIACHVSLIH